MGAERAPSSRSPGASRAKEQPRPEHATLDSAGHTRPRVGGSELANERRPFPGGRCDRDAEPGDPSAQALQSIARAWRAIASCPRRPSTLRTDEQRPIGPGRSPSRDGPCLLDAPHAEVQIHRFRQEHRSSRERARLKARECGTPQPTRHTRGRGASRARARLGGRPQASQNGRRKPACPHSLQIRAQVSQCVAGCEQLAAPRHRG